jgi:hypothetical protein
MITITNGRFQYPDGSPIAGGTVLFELSEDDQELVTPGRVVFLPPVSKPSAEE